MLHLTLTVLHDVSSQKHISSCPVIAFAMPPSAHPSHYPASLHIEAVMLPLAYSGLGRKMTRCAEGVLNSDVSDSTLAFLSRASLAPQHSLIIAVGMASYRSGWHVSISRIAGTQGLWCV